MFFEKSKKKICSAEVPHPSPISAKRVLKRDRLLVLREGANTDHPSWALVLYTRAVVISSNLMVFSSFWPLLLVCKAGPPLDMAHGGMNTFGCSFF